MGGGVEVFAPAKLNLHLSVGPVGGDGYHPVTTVLQAIALGDTVTASEAPALSFNCSPDLGMADADNLAYRAATSFAHVLGRRPAVSVSVRKAIPAGAGLGGGSSDAAAVLRVMARLWGIPLSDPRVGRTAAALGADVAFFLGAPAALMTGRGDILERELDAPVFHVAVIWPRVPVSTADAYAALDASPPRAAVGPERLIAALEGGDWRDVAARLHNDMTDSSTRMVPVIGEALGLLREAEGVVGAEMCGSGSAVFGVCATEAAARIAAEKARERGWWAAATQSCGGADTVGWNARRGSTAGDESGEGTGSE